MKRKEHILVVSLALFNEEGEANLSAVDIANELDISPGNLYYHFKGKEEIVSALFAEFEQGVIALINKAGDMGESLEEHWLYLFVTMEQVYQFRFFFRNLTDLLLRYRTIDKPFRRLLNLQYKTLRGLLQQLVDKQVLVNDGLTEERLDQLTDNAMLVINHWFQYQNLRSRQVDQQQFINTGVLQIMTLLAPYLGEQQLRFMDACRELYQQAALPDG